jgi:hypothetical protein
MKSGLLVQSSRFSRYYLRSSLTGNTIVEYDQNGAKQIATVYAGNQVIAQETPVNLNQRWVVWQHTNPVTGDGINTNSQG